MKAMGFGEQVKAVEAGKCPFCRKDVSPDEFRDELSKKEFKISGLCQKCMDKMFQ